MRRVLGLVLVLSAAACSLPLPRDVQTVRAVEAQRRERGDIQVLPPGPKAGASPEAVVEGFLGAEANAEGAHGIARQFLTSSEVTAWQDDVEVQVYDPDRVEVHRVSAANSVHATVEVSSYVTGRVRADGSYTAQTASPVRESYELQRIRGEWRLAHVPDGLRLTPADRERSYQPSSVYYLAQAVADSPAHLVPDQVFLPVGSDRAGSLVRRVLEQPSAALRGSVTSAFPPGTRARSVVVSGSGIVTVDLDGALNAQAAAVREGLSAQLVWTLRGLGASFTGLRVLQNGAPVSVPNEGQVQDASDWNGFDPEGLGPSPPYYFVATHRLRSVLTLPSGAATAGDPGSGGAFSVDAVAVSPDRSQFALLEGQSAGPVTVRTGPVRGPFTTGPTAPGLSSPTWGSGQFGLWMLQARRQVVLLPNGSRSLRAVTVLGQPTGALESLAMSRDGARAALVVGGQPYVGRVEVVSGQPRIVDLSLVLPGLTHATRLAWSSGTELAVLGALTRNAQVLRVAVDGSSVTVVNSAGLAPVSVAASSAGLLLGSGSALYELAGRGFARVQVGGAPVYPG